MGRRSRVAFRTPRWSLGPSGLQKAAPPDPAQGWRSRNRWWLVAVEEGVDRAVRSLVEVVGDVVSERRPVRAGATDVEGEGAIPVLPFWLKPLQTVNLPV